MKHIVQFSFGEASWHAAKLVVARHGAENTILLFADTKSEDEDTYRWGRAAAANVGAELVEIADGRTIWEVFADRKFIGNSRIDPCSLILKRQLCDRWIQDRFQPSECVLHFGIGLFEKKRADRIKARIAPYEAGFPLLAPPHPGPGDIRKAVLDAGLWVQRLYREGFAHANCGGCCVKAGHAQWRRLLAVMPERFAECEAKEEELRVLIGKDVSILARTKQGRKHPLTLRQFREDEQAGKECEASPVVGGCACFSD